jgi:DNA-binding NarL/FixJ family response regulator
VAGRGEAARVRERAAARATDRELLVVVAVLEAGSEKAAAHRLGVSPSTVKHHLANARSKVGAANTAQLVWILGQRLPQPTGSARPDESELRDHNRGRQGVIDLLGR